MKRLLHAMVGSPNVHQLIAAFLYGMITCAVWVGVTRPVPPLICGQLVDLPRFVSNIHDHDYKTNMISIIASGPSEFLELAFWTVNNKVAATGKCYFGVIERIDRDLPETDEQSADTIEIFVRDRVSLQDAIIIVNQALDRVADVNGLQSIRDEVTFVDDVHISTRTT
ncbi:MAG: hypothetical protein HKN43_00180 [Rhodothermales bacterium]|nr:hypothetical protein [Rhodothermales bacterium]